MTKSPTRALVRPKKAQFVPKLGAARAQELGLILRTPWDMLKTSVFTAISNFVWLWWGLLRGHVADMCPHVPKLRHVGPQLGPSWSQLVRVRRKLRSSWAQLAPVQPNLRPRTAKFEPGRLLVGPSGPASFPLCLMGAGGSRREATRIKLHIDVSDTLRSFQHRNGNRSCSRTEILDLHLSSSVWNL